MDRSTKGICVITIFTQIYNNWKEKKEKEKKNKKF